MEESLIKIAVVDDHTLFRKGLVELVSSFPNMQVVMQMVSGEAFLHELEKAKEIPDICLLDVNMPGLNAIKRCPLCLKNGKK